MAVLIPDMEQFMSVLTLLRTGGKNQSSHPNESEMRNKWLARGRETDPAQHPGKQVSERGVQSGRR